MASDKEIHVARVYAKSLFDLASQSGDLETIAHELAELCGYLDMNTDFDRYLSSPMVDVDVRRASIEKIFRNRASDLFVNALQVINNKGRLGVLRAIAEAYRLLLEESKNRVFVQVQTAVPLSDQLRSKLAASLAKLAGKEVDLEEEVDPSLIGGLVVKLGDEKYDSSVLRRISTLSHRLAERAMAESRQSERLVQNGQVA